MKKLIAAIAILFIAMINPAIAGHGHGGGGGGHRGGGGGHRGGGDGHRGGNWNHGRGGGRNWNRGRGGGWGGGGIYIGPGYGTNCNWLWNNNRPKYYDVCQ